MKKSIFYSFAFTVISIVLISVAHAELTFVTIGTGDITGVYYPAGGAIANMINKKRDQYGIRATVESTSGSVFNVNEIMKGDLEFGIVQSDCQYQAINGYGEWKDKGPQVDLRSVFSIHPESVTLVAALDTGINTILDLKGKKVNIGNLGSGHRQNAIDALKAVGIDYEKDIKAESAIASEAPKLLQDGGIDAFFYTVGHPSEAIKEATSGARKVRFISITGIDEFLRQYPYYAKSLIPISLYPGVQNDKDVETFGVKATLVTSVKVSNDIVYAITKEVFDNLEDFKKLHPAFSNLTKESMLEGLSAPLHPGALKYFKETKLIN